MEIVVYDHPSNPDSAKIVMNGKDVARTEFSRFFFSPRQLKPTILRDARPLKIKRPAQCCLIVLFTAAAPPPPPAIRYLNTHCLSTGPVEKLFSCFL